MIGRILSDITPRDRTDFPIEAFRPDRPALSDPDHRHSRGVQDGTFHSPV